MPATSRKWHKWKRNGESRKRFHEEPKRVPLDKCSVPLWRHVSTVLQELWCPFDKPWINPRTLKKHTGMKIIRYIITLEHFRGGMFSFVWNKASVRDMRDDSTMTHDEFRRYVKERTGEEFKLPI